MGCITLTKHNRQEIKMGHDITAYKPGVNRIELAEALNLNVSHPDEEWHERYLEYKRAVEVAYLRRTAHDPLNQVLYLALGVMDEAYGGCSGNGSTLSITLSQLATAKRILLSKTFEGMKREPNLADVLIKEMGYRLEPATKNDVSVECEIQFIEDCMGFMIYKDVDSIEISFA